MDATQCVLSNKCPLGDPTMDETELDSHLEEKYFYCSHSPSYLRTEGDKAPIEDAFRPQCRHSLLNK